MFGGWKAGRVGLCLLTRRSDGPSLRTRMTIRAQDRGVTIRKVAANSDFANTEPVPVGSTGLGSREPLVTFRQPVSARPCFICVSVERPLI